MVKSIRAILLMKKLLILGGILALPFSGFATILFDQSSNIEPDGFFSDAISTNGSQFYGQAIGDDFTIASNSVINTITFWGESENFLFDDMTNMASFDIQILDSTFDTVATWTVSTASLSPTLTGQFGTFSGNSGFIYTATVNQAIAAGSYVLHIGSTLVAPNDDAWVWSQATGNDDLKVNFMAGNGWEDLPANGDNAFRIEGTVDPVPEPASLAVLGVGALALLRRRKK